MIDITITTRLRGVLATQEGQTPCPVHRTVVKARKDIVYKEVYKTSCPRFKEWISDHKGLEFTLDVTIPQVPPNIVFGPFNFEREPI